MNKKRILYFSDCPFFAGCENMIPNFLNSKELNSQFELGFIYRRSKSYERELFQRFTSDENVKFIPVVLPKQHMHRGLARFLGAGSLLYKLLSAIVIVVWKYLAIFMAVIPLLRILKKETPDVLHINNGGYPAANTSYSVIIAAKLAGVKKIVYVVNNIAQDYSSPVRWLDFPLDFLVKRNVTKFITGSKNAGAALNKVLSLKDRQLVNIPNGITPRAITKEKKVYLESIGLANHKGLIFSTIALFEERKGHIFLLEAIRLLKSKKLLEDMPLFILEGDGSEREKLEEFIRLHNLGDEVIMIGHEKSIFNLINASDVIVLPSIRNEDFPNIILEAMSAGKPTIGTKIAGIPEQINNDVNGLLIEPRDPDALANAIKEITEIEKIKKFSKAALKKFNENYETSISVENYMKLYKRIINNK